MGQNEYMLDLNWRQRDALLMRSNSRVRDQYFRVTLTIKVTGSELNSMIHAVNVSAPFNLKHGTRFSLEVSPLQINQADINLVFRCERRNETAKNILGVSA